MSGRFEEGIIEIRQEDDEKKFVFSDFHSQALEHAIKGSDHIRLYGLGHEAGRAIMEAILPEGTVGQTVDIARDLIKEKDSVEPGKYNYATHHFLSGSIAAALDVAAMHERAVVSL